jgi:hypothetical protein
MPVNWNANLLIGVVAFSCCTCLSAQQSGDKIALDLFLFNQEDGTHIETHEGGNPILSEKFLYAGVRASGRFKVSNLVTLRSTWGLSTIEPAGEADPPETISNATHKLTTATTTSASASNFTASGIMDIHPDGEWTYSPGVFFSYQPTYVSRGLEFTATGDHLGGNTTTRFSYSVRWDSLTGGNLRVSGVWGTGLPKDDGVNGFERRLRNRYAHNLEFGITQILSSDWRVNATVQYTRQDGYLAEPNAQVTIYDGDTPVRFSDERLPNYRNRFQLSFRARYSPALGFALGMDHAAYIDDWGVSSFALEPTVEGTFGHEDAHWRVWYRFAYQQGTRYMREQPQRTYKFQTDDPDLGTFRTHSGGLLFTFQMPGTGEYSWLLRVSGYALHRSDLNWGYGALIGSEIGW